jgi:hypothetical protein
MRAEPLEAPLSCSDESRNPMSRHQAGEIRSATQGTGTRKEPQPRSRHCVDRLHKTI